MSTLRKLKTIVLFKLLIATTLFYFPASATISLPKHIPKTDSAIASTASKSKTVLWSIKENHAGTYVFREYAQLNSNNANRAFTFSTPWKPTHISTSNTNMLAVGSLKANGNRNANNQVKVFDSSGEVFSLDNVLMFDLVSSGERLFCIRKNEKQMLTFELFQTTGKRISRRVFDKTVVGEDFYIGFEVSANGNSIVLKPDSADSSATEKVVAYSGDNYALEETYSFDKALISEALHFGTNGMLLVHGGILSYFVDNKNIWTFNPKIGGAQMDILAFDENHNYILFGDTFTGNFMVLNNEGKAIVEHYDTNDLEVNVPVLDVPFVDGLAKRSANYGVALERNYRFIDEYFILSERDIKSGEYVYMTIDLATGQRSIVDSIETIFANQRYQ